MYSVMSHVFFSFFFSFSLRMPETSEERRFTFARIDIILVVVRVPISLSL